VSGLERTGGLRRRGILGVSMSDADRNPRLSVLEGVVPLRGARIPSEILAGVTLATLAVPEVMGYTKIAGTPVITGLYTLLVPMLIFAVFGSSRHLVVGADSATAAILAAGLVGLATAGSAEYVGLAGALAFLAAAFLAVARVARLGFLADFLSRTVLVGFLTGVGIQVALGQIAGMLGLPNRGHGPLAQLWNDWRQIAEVAPVDVAISAAVLGVVFGARAISRRIPGALLAVVGATAASWLLDLEAAGAHLVGSVPSGLPSFGLPQVDWSWPLLQRLIPTAFAMFVVILAQSAATSRAYAARYDERFDENVDLVGLVLANVGAALSGTFVVNGSPTKTEMVDAAGGRSQLAHLTTVAIVLGVLLFLTAPLAYMPGAALSAIVFAIGLKLIDPAGLRAILRERPWEFWVALLTTAVVVFWGVEQGIVLAMGLSLVAHTRHGYRPKNTVVVADEQGRWRVRPVSSAAQIAPGLLVYRFSHGMYYANAQQLMEEILALASQARPPLVWLCIDAAAVDDVDYTAAYILRSVQTELQARGIRLVFSAVSEHVHSELERSGLVKRVGEGGFFATAAEALDAYRQRAGR
jgi:SulP family sulfate permease